MIKIRLKQLKKNTIARVRHPELVEGSKPN